VANETVYNLVKGRLNALSACMSKIYLNYQQNNESILSIAT